MLKRYEYSKLKEIKIQCTSNMPVEKQFKEQQN